MRFLKREFNLNTFLFVNVKLIIYFCKIITYCVYDTIKNNYSLTLCLKVCYIICQQEISFTISSQIVKM